MGHDIVAIGASAGGPRALLEVVPALPRDLGASVFVVLHVAPTDHDVFGGLLARRAALPVTYARDRESIVRGHVYCAPAAHNLLLERGRVRVQRPAQRQQHVPSIDALFASAAAAYGRRVVGVVLTGALSDGAAGAIEIKKNGGVVVVQDPEEAEFREMPDSVIRGVEVDYRVRLAALPSLLQTLTKGTRTSPAGGG